MKSKKKDMYREWSPQYFDTKLMRIANGFRKYHEGVFLWPFFYKENFYILAIFSNIWDVRFRRPKGFKLFDQNREDIEDIGLTKKIAKYFIIWERLYHSPPVKVLISRDKIFKQQQLYHEKFAEQCRKHIIKINKEITEDTPFLHKKRLESLRELDKDVVENYKMFIKHDKVLKDVMDFQKKVYEKWTATNLDDYKPKLEKLKIAYTPLIKYTEKRGEIYREHELIAKQYYSSKFRYHNKVADILIDILPLSFVAKIIFKNTPDILEYLLSSIGGSRSLFKSIDNKKKTMKKYDEILELYKIEISNALIRLNT